MMVPIIQKLSRHLAIPVGLAALLLIGFFASLNHTHQNAGTLYVKDHYGNRSVLDHVIITGDTGDRKVNTPFQIAKGQVTSLTKVYDPPLLLWDRYKYIPGMRKRMGDWEYQVEGGQYSQYVTFRGIDQLHPGKGGKSSYINGGIVNPDFTNVLEYGLAFIRDNVYYTVPTSAKSSGVNGIYELSFEEDVENRTVTEYSLDQNKDGGSFEVLGLEAAGDKLALILEDNGQIKVRGYDSKSGHQIGEITLAQTEDYFQRYEAYSNDQTLNLVFQRSTDNTNQDGQFHKVVFSVDFTDGMKLIDQTILDYEDSDVYMRSRMTMLHRDGKLYVVFTSTEAETPEGVYLKFVHPMHLLIRVYEAGKPIYEGELMNDVNDDSIRFINMPADQYSRVVPMDEDRIVDHIKLQ